MLTFYSNSLFIASWYKKKVWEYKYLALSSSQTQDYEKNLSQLGADGWELVAAEREQPGGLVHFYFKRAK